MAQQFKQGDKVVWRVTSGFCTLQWAGEVTALRRGGKECYVLFDGGGHWLEPDYLEHVE